MLLASQTLPATARHARPERGNVGAMPTPEEVWQLCQPLSAGKGAEVATKRLRWPPDDVRAITALDESVRWASTGAFCFRYEIDGITRKVVLESEDGKDRETVGEGNVAFKVNGILHGYDKYKPTWIALSDHEWAAISISFHEKVDISYAVPDINIMMPHLPAGDVVITNRAGTDWAHRMKQEMIHRKHQTLPAIEGGIETALEHSVRSNWNRAEKEGFTEGDALSVAWIYALGRKWATAHSK